MVGQCSGKDWLGGAARLQQCKASTIIDARRHNNTDSSEAVYLQTILLLLLQALLQQQGCCSRPCWSRCGN